MKKSILIAAVIAVIAEGILWWAYNKYGVIYFGHGHANELGLLGFLFHAPGGILSMKLFGNGPHGAVADFLALFIVIAIGALQFFLLVWPLVAICRALRRKPAAKSLTPQP